RPRWTLRSRNFIAWPTATRAANFSTNALTGFSSRSPSSPRRAAARAGGASPGGAGPWGGAAPPPGPGPPPPPPPAPPAAPGRGTCRRARPPGVTWSGDLAVQRPGVHAVLLQQQDHVLVWRDIDRDLGGGGSRGRRAPAPGGGRCRAWLQRHRVQQLHLLALE